MSDCTDIAPLLLVVDALTAPPPARIWGSGGWMNPAEREALDWHCLARSMGWEVDIVTCDASALQRALQSGRRWIVFACDPAAISMDVTDVLRDFVQQESAVVIARAADRGSPWAHSCGSYLTGESFTGWALSWTGVSAEDWRCRQPFTAMQLAIEPSASGLATLEQGALISSRACGQGALIALGFHPSESRDANGCATALLRKLLIYSAAAPVAWFNLSRSVACRMDDPGAAQSVYLGSWSYRQLGGADWRALLEVLARHHARLSVCYVGGWVDDGDAQRGELTIDGVSVARVAGRTHSSASVVYRDIGGHLPGTTHDYRGQYAVLREAHCEGRIDIQLHGHTHMHPDAGAWAQAPDRYELVDWFRELGPRAAPTLADLSLHEHPLALGLQEIQRRFGIVPSTLICPGDAWTTTSLEAALELGLEAVSSYYYAFRHKNRLCWSQHVCAPYLNEPDACWFDSGLPVVGYFHDCEPSREGPQWLDHWLTAWQAAGARRFISLQELAAAHCGSVRMVRRDADWQLEATCGTASHEGVTLPVSIYQPAGGTTCSLTARLSLRG